MVAELEDERNCMVTMVMSQEECMWVGFLDLLGARFINRVGSSTYMLDGSVGSLLVG